MQIINISLEKLKSASWNSNQMDEKTLEKLKESIRRYGVVENLVVRKTSDEVFEVLSGNQRLTLLAEMGFSDVPCVVVDLDDARARLLAQALNHIRGKDDLGLRAELMKEVLKSIPQTEVLAILPDTGVNLNSMVPLGKTEVADYLQKWQQAQPTKLRHMQFQFTQNQKDIVDQALNLLLPEAKTDQSNSPNTRSTAFYLLCKEYLERRKSDGK